MNKSFKYENKKSWLITYEIYRVVSSMTSKVDIQTKIVDAPTFKEAYESLKKENHKIIITYVKEI